MKIGLISDTHGYIDQTILNFLEPCQEIWHAGDFGSQEVIDKLSDLKPLKGVYGNIDNQQIRQQFPEELLFEREGCSIYMTHIGGYPPKYNKQVKPRIKRIQPDIFICGHSHILKVMSDKQLNNLLYINPGAAGYQGFHKMRTLIRFEIENAKPRNLEVIELGKRGKISTA
ncbi:MAG: metallophosphoesterase family protein [Candidatus Cyclobacteriaceae bacterium M3_2C_046]